MLSLSRRHCAVLIVLALVEVVTALFLASINPAHGHDETWYLLYARHIRGGSSLPYQYYRPPMLPLLLVVFGSYYRFVSAFAHMGSAVLIFLILRRVVSRNLAIVGLAVFMVSGELRTYNVLMLTEMPSIFFLLLAVYAFAVQRPFLVGMTLALAVMTGWGMAVVAPVVLVLYAARREWRGCASFVSGLALVFMPFLVVFAMKYGNPLDPFLYNLSVQGGIPNDRLSYLRQPHLLPFMMIVGSGVAMRWIWLQRRNWETLPYYTLHLLLLGAVFARLVLLQCISNKAFRFLVPLHPLLLLLSISMIWHYTRPGRKLRWVLCSVLFISVMPTKHLFYQAYGLARHPMHAIGKFSDSLAEFPLTEPIYTDLNDQAVMAQTAHPTVAVTGAGASHRPLGSRPAATRAEIPDGALYLTWDPGYGELVASATVPQGETLWLVRWRRVAPSENEQLRP